MTETQTPSTWPTRCLDVVMPVYNESATLERIVPRVLEQPGVAGLIMVDDASTDGSWDIVQRMADREPRIRAYRHPENRGKGAALRTGFAQTKAPAVIVQDADLEYDPSEYERLVRLIREDRADVVFGSRFMGSEAHRVLYFWHSVGNHILTLFSNMLSNLNLTDMETCFKCFRKTVLDRIQIEEDRFGFEPEITAKVAKLRVRIYEVAVSYYGRTYQEGKKINWKDGVAAFRCILQYNLRSSGKGITS